MRKQSGVFKLKLLKFDGEFFLKLLLPEAFSAKNASNRVRPGATGELTALPQTP